MSNILGSGRYLRGITQVELGMAIGKSATWVSFVESGQLQPKPEDAEKIAEILNIEISVLFPSLKGGVKESK